MTAGAAPDPSSRAERPADGTDVNPIPLSVIANRRRYQDGGTVGRCQGSGVDARNTAKVEVHASISLAGESRYGIACIVQ